MRNSEQPDRFAEKRVELGHFISGYHTALQNLEFAPDGGTESGMYPSEIFSKIVDLCEEIEPGSTTFEGVTFQEEEDEEDEVLSVASRIAKGNPPESVN